MHLSFVDRKIAQGEILKKGNMGLAARKLILQ